MINHDEADDVLCMFDCRRILTRCKRGFLAAPAFVPGAHPCTKVPISADANVGYSDRNRPTVERNRYIRSSLGDAVLENTLSLSKHFSFNIF